MPGHAKKPEIPHNSTSFRVSPRGKEANVEFYTARCRPVSEYVGIFLFFNPTARWNGRLRVRNGHSGHAPRTTYHSGQWTNPVFRGQISRVFPPFPGYREK